MKTVKQVDAIHQRTIVNLSTKAEAVEAIGVIAGLNLESLVGVQIVDPVTHLRSAKHTAKNVFTATKGTF